MYRSIDLFAGIGGTRMGFDQAFGDDIETVFVSEIDKFAVQTYQENFGTDAQMVGDITKIDEKDIPEHDIILAGFPCFVAGSLVQTNEGLKPIEQIKPGDFVLTHKGRYRQVLRVGTKQHAETVILKGAGTDYIECTANHPFLASEKRNVYIKDDTGKGKTVARLNEQEQEWLPAEQMANHFWLNVKLNEPENFHIPKMDFTNSQISAIAMDEDFFYMVGRWLGDGWCTVYERKDRHDSIARRTIICASYEEADELEKYLNKTDIHFVRSEEPTVVKFIATIAPLQKWLTDNFGCKASGKYIPGWVLNAPESLKRALLRGYIDADGEIWNNGTYKITSINKTLLLGAKMLANILGWHAVLHPVRTPDSTVIEGRTVNNNDFFILNIGQNYTRAVKSDFGWWGRCRSVTPGRKNVNVYNLEVEEDHSYTIDGIAVHNCQAFSQAGSKKGFSDFYKGRARGTLFFDILRIATYHKPKVIFCENVKGLIRHDGGKTFKVIKGALEETGYKVFYKVLNTKDFGMPQNRERTYIVAFRNDIAPEAFVFPDPPCPKTELKDILEKKPAKKYFITENYLQALINHRKRHEEKGHGFGYIVRDKNDIAATLTCSGSGRENNLIQDKREDWDFEGYKGPDKKVNHLFYRVLTPREFARLQGYPDSFKIPVSDTQAYKQFGNSVSVPVVAAVAEKIYETLKATDGREKKSKKKTKKKN